MVLPRSDEDHPMHSMQSRPVGRGAEVVRVRRPYGEDDSLDLLRATYAALGSATWVH